MAITNLTELIEVLKTDPTLQSVAVTRDGTSVTQLRVNPIAFGINSQSTTATVSVTTEGLVSLQELPSDLVAFKANDTAEQVYTGAQTANNEALVESYSDAKVKAYLAIHDGPVVGSTGIFAELAITDQLVVPRLSNGNIIIDNNTIISSESNSDIDIVPNGTGQTIIKSDSSIVGNLNVEGTIKSYTSNQNLTLVSNGSGKISVDDIEIEGNNISTSDSSGINILQQLSVYSDLNVDGDITGPTIQSILNRLSSLESRVNSLESP
jgi:hypothetical protein